MNHFLFVCFIDAQHTRRGSSFGSFENSTLEEMSLGEKVEHVAMHSIWLKENHHLLMTLYNHCIMQGTGGGDLPGDCYNSDNL